MSKRSLQSGLLALGLLAALGGHAMAAWPEDVSTRALGMGGALRGAATGDAGPMLNPSGMGLARAYAVEARYQLTQNETSHRPHLSIVDSTSAFRIAGGAYYTYLNAKPGISKLSGHEGGVALAVPFGERVFVGGQIKYLRLTTESPAVAPTVTGEKDKLSGFNFDLGATVRPVDQLSIGGVVYNLNDQKTPLTPFSAGGGVTFMPLPVVTVTFDTVVDFTTYDDKAGNKTSLMGGAEYMTPNGVAVRVGGGKNGVRDAGYLSAGASAVSELGALDIGFSRDISGGSKFTVFAISLRLFAATPIDPG
ncbi:MAG: hypothetical protein SF187_11400 [Deltaproteobacteria bacterium]|nr:hypothetical protein [Deltaproteobacteria bacterium]